MKRTPPKQPKGFRIGSPDPASRVRRSLANVTLEGVRPDPRTRPIIESVAAGDTDPQTAVAEIRSWYGRKS